MSSKYNNYKSSVVSVTTSETLLLARNNNRTGLILQNQGASDVNVYFESNSTMYFILEAGKAMHLPAAPQNEINAVSTSGTIAVTVLEC